ncbi:MAG: HAD hydrolase-like protein [candidate division KSB1 bacterium]|nr:HAD hydrolase-like protein [candidate division KSB1 bacterium]
MITIHPSEAPTLLEPLGQEFAIIENPAYVFPPYDVVPLAPKILTPRERLVAVVQDMDGTTTTTENLCLHSLETMVRRVTNRPRREEWTGLDRQRDYPHIIGNSTTKHVEYLLKTYGDAIDLEAFREAYLQAALWTVANRPDERRTEEVLTNLRHFGCADLLEVEPVRSWLARASDCGALAGVPEEARPSIQRVAQRIPLADFTDRVRAAIDIYYQRYHEILIHVRLGKAEQFRNLLPDPSRRLIEPMPGVAVFLAAVKGWLGAELALFYELLCGHCPDPGDAGPQRQTLAALGHHLEEHPLKVAVVTSSIAYEANIVLCEVFRVICEEVESWPVSADRRRWLQEQFADYHRVFDVVVTASDSSEIRLKPHRDLYSLALHQLGVAKSDFNKVIGFEDSESGVIAIRAAGVGLCVAVPFSDTRGHNLEQAAYVLHGGLPEALLRHALFLDPRLLQG